MSIDYIMQERRSTVQFSKMTISVLAIVGGMFLAAGVAHAQTTWHVDDLNCPGPGSGTDVDPFCKIQTGIDAAVDGDTVIVADGTYTGAGNRDLDFGGALITVRSANGPDNCIIDCQGSQADPHRGFIFQNGETEGAVVEGFTITNGYISWPENGGGMFISGSSPTVSDCTFDGNTGGFGGGMANINSSPAVTNCAFSGNDADTGGGMANINSSPTVTNCTISGNGAGSGGGMYNFDNSSPTVTNCTISNNMASFFSGGGMRNEDNSSPTVTNCTISNNMATWGGGMSNSNSSPTVTDCTFLGNAVQFFFLPGATGGGMRNVNSSPTVTHCTFSANTAGGGAGMDNVNSSPVVSYCTFSGNAAMDGGGMSNISGSSPTVSNCIFDGNTAASAPFTGVFGGGGMSNRDSSNPAVSNCTFSGNTAEFGGAMHNTDSVPVVTDSILWGNTDPQINGPANVSYSGIEGGWPGEGNIDLDPLFVDSGFWDDNGTPGIPDDDFWVEGDYHLLQGSPCIDAADNETVAPDSADHDDDGDTNEPIPFDLDGNPRFVNDLDTQDTGVSEGGCPIIDMGVYEFPGTQECCPSDLTGDGSINAADLALLLGSWGKCEGCDADLNGDLTVDAEDLALLLGSWGACG